ncbi:MAG: carboxymuconolactone decarboxylase family protein [Pelagimonas sp.]|uniref:carboxymuconolactone decarboxylase family protein n=1 Tax=Pelagimonas sp. TaxID=2073170 RepID=UPI003D6AE05B
MEPRMNFWAAAPDIVKALQTLNTALEESGLEASLRHLLKLRASQINGCAFCVDMHTREARNDGETEQRLFLTSAWHDSFLFTERERAAFAWTEALTLLSDKGPTDELYEATRAHFDEAEMMKLTSLIGMINVWNRVSIAFRAVHSAPTNMAA